MVLREPLKTHKNLLITETLKAQRKSKARKPEMPSAFLAFLCVSVVSGF
jgi:hypothetical protein